MKREEARPRPSEVAVQIYSLHRSVDRQMRYNQDIGSKGSKNEGNNIRHGIERGSARRSQHTPRGVQQEEDVLAARYTKLRVMDRRCLCNDRHLLLLLRAFLHQGFVDVG